MACTWQQSIYKYLLIRFLSQYYVSSQAEGRGFESRLPLEDGIIVQIEGSAPLAFPSIL